MNFFTLEQAIAPWWHERSLRERAVLAALAALLAALVGYRLFWQPAMDNIEQLQQELPVLRTDWARMQAMAAELTAARSQTAAAVPTGAELNALLRQSLQEAGLNAQKLDTRPDGRIMLEWHDATFNRMADWLDQARQKWRVSVVEGHVERALHPGEVNARMVLRGGG